MFIIIIFGKMKIDYSYLSNYLLKDFVKNIGMTPVRSDGAKILC